MLCYVYLWDDKFNHKSLLMKFRLRFNKVLETIQKQSTSLFLFKICYKKFFWGKIVLLWQIHLSIKVWNIFFFFFNQIFNAYNLLNLSIKYIEKVLEFIYEVLTCHTIGPYLFISSRAIPIPIKNTTKWNRTWDMFLCSLHFVDCEITEYMFETFTPDYA